MEILRSSFDLLSRTLDVVSGLSLPVKSAWGAWLVWCVLLLALSRDWLRRAHLPLFRRAPPPPPPARKSSVRRSAARPGAKKPAVSPYGTSDFLAVLEEEQAISAFPPER